MRENFNPDLLFNRLPYSTTVPSECLGMERLEFVCQGDATQLEEILKDTPFLLAEDRFSITFSDFRNDSVVAFLDAMVTIPVRFRDLTGGTPAFVYESAQRMVLGGREKWGYPKRLAHLALNIGEESASGSVIENGKEVMNVTWKADSTAQPKVFTAPKTAPHILVRCLPARDREGIDFAEVLTRDTTPNFVLHSRTAGTGTVEFFSAPEGEPDRGLAGLTVKEVLSAARVTGNWYSTEQYGWGHLVERLV